MSEADEGIPNNGLPPEDPRAKRPEWIVCIDNPRAHPRGDPGRRSPVQLRTWCGERRLGFTFRSLDHAAANGLEKGRLVACEECVRAAREALEEGQEKIAEHEAKVAEAERVEWRQAHRACADVLHGHSFDVGLFSDPRTTDQCVKCRWTRGELLNLARELGLKK